MNTTPYRCRDIGYGVDTGTVELPALDWVDPTGAGKRAYRSPAGETVYLFDDELWSGFTSLAAVKQANRDAGHHWFDPATLAFFRSKVSGELVGGRFFVSSECPPDGRRAYTVRCALANGSITTMGEFMGHATLAAAKRAAWGYANDVTMGREVLDQYDRPVS